MRESKWFKEGWEAFAKLEKPGVVESPYGAKSAKALIFEEGFRAAAREYVAPDPKEAVDGMAAPA